MKNILFFTPYSFRQVNGGSVLFRELLSAYKNLSLSWYICTESPKQTILDYDFRKISYYNSSIFNFALLNTIARRIPILGIPFFFLKYKLISIYCSKNAIKFIRNENYEKIWIYAYHFSIPVARRVHEKLKIPIHLSVQDDIYTHLPRFESKLLDADFRYLMENASSIDFVSKEMGKYYSDKYKLKANTMTFMVSHQIKVEKPKLSDQVLKIGYAGNIWCKENFESLMDAVKELNNHSISLRLFIFTNGDPSHHFSKFKQYIEFSGMVDYERLIYKLQSCDLLYVPMTFDPKRKITNITSFPSKLLTYLNAKIPILNHSPIDAVSHSFVNDNKVGYSINSLHKEEIIRFFIDKDGILNIKNRMQCSENAELALSQFNKKAMTDNFIKFINSNHI